jgi:hypothetical protein
MIGVQTLEKRTSGLRQENDRLKETFETFKIQNAELGGLKRWNDGVRCQNCRLFL